MRHACNAGMYTSDSNLLNLADLTTFDVWIWVCKKPFIYFLKKSEGSVWHWDATYIA